ncbi:Panacea domain-containing protein [Neopusillimonas aromaticivorans]|uniref:Panacea domain-containing protein n=1 Tax=Neopusillimonas aromaticivorans TaxID=2979868 RepID=UPI002596A9A0|nr:Panacea domain-containing protein [Neopusillimonas aromaticivorans]WJJ93982.1 Panacea domain-containing protein [Neopusillimonas aromaticivorans]
MNEILQAIIRYLCQVYPHPDELSNARVTKMVYLADWEYARRYGRQLTDIHWNFNHYGPFVNDVIQAANTDPLMRIEQAVNYYGSPKTLLVYCGPEQIPGELGEHARQVLDGVIHETAGLTFRPFIEHVYSTYPIRTADRYEYLDLVQSAEQEGRRRTH